MTNRGDQFELNNRNEIISKRASVGYVNRNLTNDGRLRYYYDCENRLTEVNDVNDAPVASYKYDFAGRRVNFWYFNGKRYDVLRYIAMKLLKNSRSARKLVQMNKG